jgi:hypothetical protein
MKTDLIIKRELSDGGMVIATMTQGDSSYSIKVRSTVRIEPTYETEYKGGFNDAIMFLFSKLELMSFNNKGWTMIESILKNIAIQGAINAGATGLTKECACCGDNCIIIDMLPDPRDSKQEILVCVPCEYEITERASPRSDD